MLVLIEEPLKYCVAGYLSQILLETMELYYWSTVIIITNVQKLNDVHVS